MGAAQEWCKCLAVHWYQDHGHTLAFLLFVLLSVVALAYENLV